MPRARPPRPERAITLTTYVDLERYVRAFNDGHLNMLLVVGSHGLQKSRLVRDVVGDRAVWIENRASAFGLYEELYAHRDEPLVMDDVDGLYGDRDAVRLLKCVLQTEPIKTVSWHSKAAEQAGLPTRFQTRSRAVIIANEWKTLRANVAALEDRGHAVAFEPPPLEVHRRAGLWFWDQEIYTFIGDHLGFVTRPSMRDYVRAWESKNAGLPWRDHLLARWLDGPGLLVAQLRADPSFGSEAERERAFEERGGGSRSTYYNTKKKLPPAVTAPTFLVTNRPPESPGAEKPLSGVLDLLRERHGKLGNG
jgi:hypothetical protein